MNEPAGERGTRLDMGTTGGGEVSVVTIAKDRRAHLARHREWLARNAAGVEHVIVDMGGESIPEGPGTIVDFDTSPERPLPLAAARNAGVRATGSDVVVFLDVDCLAGTGLVSTYCRRVARYGGVWSGPVGHLPPSDTIGDWSQDALCARAVFHDGRPRLGQAPAHAPGPELFWSLSFALSRTTWELVGGFDEDYTGYGGEDTDFARTAVARGIELWFDGSALAFHQHHPVSSPPVEHLDDIVRNANLFHAKWGVWPMEGWLRAFCDAGEIVWSPDMTGGIGAR